MDDFTTLPIPAILKPERRWTGKQLFSILIPNGFQLQVSGDDDDDFTERDTCVLVKSAIYDSKWYCNKCKGIAEENVAMPSDAEDVAKYAEAFLETFCVTCKEPRDDPSLKFLHGRLTGKNNWGMGKWGNISSARSLSDMEASAQPKVIHNIQRIISKFNEWQGFSMSIRDTMRTIKCNWRFAR